jgi:hypothetical protein
MRVIIQNGAAEFVLCKGIADDENVEGWRESSRELVQIAAYLRAVVAEAFPRGNTQTSLSFAITREHADAKICEDYMASSHRSVPKTGKLIFITEGELIGGGGVAGQSRWELTKAALEGHDRFQIGVTSIHTYSFLGGDFTEATP